MTSYLAHRVPISGSEPWVWHLSSESFMKKDRKDTNSSEPMGIVISRGDRTEPTPVFAAYIWAPAPDNAEEPETRAA
jgi:hypothetical protein